MTFQIVLTDDPDPATLERVGDGLAAFNAADVGPSGRRPLAVFAHDDAGELVAGLSAHTAWGWLAIQWLWVSEGQRRKGLAASLIAEAEAEATLRGCHGAWIDSFNPLALRLYRTLGYEPFGTLDDFPTGRSRSFLKKRLER